MDFSHRAARDDARALALFDAEFIHGRGRTLSLAQRLPGVFGTTSATTWSASDGGECVSALVTRPFDWLDAGATLRGAMIGLVCEPENVPSVEGKSNSEEAKMAGITPAGFTFIGRWLEPPS